MKRIFTYISAMAAVAAAFSCSPFEEEMAPEQPAETAFVTVTVTATADSTLTFKVAPVGEALYYSYLVEQTDEPVEYAASDIYGSKRKDVVTAGTVKWTSDAPEKIVTVSGLTQNTTYQIYAVAAGSTGLTGEVVNVTAKTSDRYAPVLVDYQTSDSLVVMIYDEPVLRGEGALTVNVYAMNSLEIETGDPVGTLEVAEENILVQDMAVMVAVAGLPSGAFYSVNYPEGAFTDPSGNAVAAHASAVVLNSDTGYEAEYYGVGGRKELSNFTLGQIEADKFASAEAPYFVLSFDSEYGYGYTYSGNYGKAVYTIGNKTTEYVLAGRTDYFYYPDFGAVVLQLPTSGDAGNTVTMSIEEGAFEDFFGNFNEAWSDEVLYSYAYTLDDIVGTYQYSAYDNYAGAVSGTFTIAESDVPESGNVMFTTFAGVPCVVPVYADFNFDSGVLSIYGQQAFFAEMDDAGTPDDPSDDMQIVYYFYTYANDYLHFSMPESGVLAGPDDYFGILATAGGSALGWVNLFLDMEAAKVVAESAATVTSAPASFSIQPLAEGFAMRR